MRVKIDSIEQSNFYKMPKKIYEYDLKPVDRELYMLCLENWRLSIANNWINGDGEIYFYATQEILAKKMNLDKKSVMRSFKKLVEIGILQVEKENGFSNKYFLTDLNIENQHQKGTGTSTKMSLPPVPKRDTIKNKYNKNELIRINKKEYIYVIWNELAEELGLSKIKMLTDKRKRKIDVLLKKYTIKEIAEALEKIKESDFLQGKISNWQMTFDDFIEERKFIKLLEDGYKNKNSNKNSDIKTDKSGRKKIDLTEEDVMDTLKGWGLQ